MANSKEVTPIYQSLTSPILILGGERETILSVGFLAIAIWIIGQDLISLCAGLGIWGIGIMIARVMAKTDPNAAKVFIKFLRYRDFYCAREKLFTPKIEREQPSKILRYHL